MRHVLSALALLLAPPAMAEGPPRVVADIAPIQSLVAQVMDGVGSPDLLLPPGASPHGYAMRPSEAAALADADLVVWVGPELTPWLERGIESLAGDAQMLTLTGAPGMRLLGFREGALFEAHGHDEHAHDEHAHDEHAHDEHAHDEHAHDEHADEHAHDEHADEHHSDEHHGDAETARLHDGQAPGDHAAEDHGHDHDGTDPHLWLDPRNAAGALKAIAASLSRLDPANAARYARNAEAAVAALNAQEEALAARLAPLAGRPFLVFHDAYHYFEARFGIEAAGALSLSDAAAPGPARLAEIRDAIGARGILCVFAEPQFDPSLARTVIEGSGARMGVLDPLGVALEPGPDLYPALLDGLVAGFEACLG